MKIILKSSKMHQLYLIQISALAKLKNQLCQYLLIECSTIKNVLSFIAENIPQVKQERRRKNLLVCYFIIKIVYFHEPLRSKSKIDCWVSTLQEMFPMLRRVSLCIIILSIKNEKSTFDNIFRTDKFWRKFI